MLALIQQRVASETLAKADSRQSAADTATSACSGSAMGRALSLSFRKKNCSHQNKHSRAVVAKLFPQMIVRTRMMADCSEIQPQVPCRAAAPVANSQGTKPAPEWEAEQSLERTANARPVPQQAVHLVEGLEAFHQLQGFADVHLAAEGLEEGRDVLHNPGPQGLLSFLKPQTHDGVWHRSSHRGSVLLHVAGELCNRLAADRCAGSRSVMLLV